MILLIRPGNGMVVDTHDLCINKTIIKIYALVSYAGHSRAVVHYPGSEEAFLLTNVREVGSGDPLVHCVYTVYYCYIYRYASNNL